MLNKQKGCVCSKENNDSCENQKPKNVVRGFARSLGRQLVINFLINKMKIGLNYVLPDTNPIDVFVDFLKDFFSDF
ncbi:hypothetical protein [Aeromonas allosaccharophila]|uniref:hypothetical protein n=1 Tax=Aeromonas allosaccharophila TaxID=656 RepID=UPI000DD0BA43|nr:hypothetical protein [Aeromonas allosaccharophila]